MTVCPLCSFNVIGTKLLPPLPEIFGMPSRNSMRNFRNPSTPLSLFFPIFADVNSKYFIDYDEQFRLHDPYQVDIR